MPTDAITWIEIDFFPNHGDALPPALTYYAGRYWQFSRITARGDKNYTLLYVPLGSEVAALVDAADLASIAAVDLIPTRGGMDENVTMPA
jgi:hypothetical protein